MTVTGITAPRMADRRGWAPLGLGTLLFAGALACSEAPEPEAPSPEPIAQAAPRGTAFIDARPVPAPQRLSPDGAIAAFAEGVDPAMLTPEALAKNPLVIGVEKREPFVLPEGADPLDPTVYGWEKDDDGYWIISYADLSLEGIDAELLLDKLVYPEFYEDDEESVEIDFPDRIKALDGEKVSLIGYQIGIEWDGKTLTEFMLVRDLMACCFGGNPKPDERVDVVMGKRGAPTVLYTPLVTRGTFRIQGGADPDGYATSAFKIEGDDAREE